MRRICAVMLTVVLSSATVSLATARAASPAGAPDGHPWVVSLGDSYISGEGGRWAGNQSWSTAAVDALGVGAYWDAGDRETIRGCHRSRSAAIHIGDVASLNLACSGAITSTRFDSRGDFKPGIDFYDGDAGKGQALMLQEFASDHRVAMVALSISGNDFKFEPIIQQCVKDFLKPFVATMCHENDEVTRNVSPARAAQVREATRGAILNVATAMERAGYEDSEWTLVVQLYPQPLPGASRMRYGESGYERQYDGGCGFRNGDLDWAKTVLLPVVNATLRAAASDALAARPSLRLNFLDTSRAFRERELCHDAVERVASRDGVESWRSPDAVDRSEWVMEINIINAFETGQQESLHPNYWGQLALRNCWRQVWNDGDVRGGVCERGDQGGLNQQCEPRMDLLASPRVARGAEGPGPKASLTSTRSTGAAVTLQCPGVVLAAGSTAVLRGRVLALDEGVTVRLLVSVNGKPWRERATAEASAQGHYRFAFDLPADRAPGSLYRWRTTAVFANGSEALSPIRTSTVITR